MLAERVIKESVRRGDGDGQMRESVNGRPSDFQSDDESSILSSRT